MNDNIDYDTYQKVKALKKSIPEFINDLADTDSLDSVYCDDCDCKLLKCDSYGGLACSRCGRLYYPATNDNERVKHGLTAGPVDFVEDSEVEDYNVIVEDYSFNRKKEKSDPYIDSLKSKGYVITDSKIE
jgi:hypothetical protein